MVTKNREKFLERYLQLFDVSKLEFTVVTQNKVCGIVYFLDNDHQEFCWHMTEEKVPQNNVIELIQLLKDQDLVDLDRIKVSRESLFVKTKQKNYKNFIAVFEELMSIRVQMLDDGKEIDSFFLHM